jgi:hypothetical protein
MSYVYVVNIVKYALEVMSLSSVFISHNNENMPRDSAFSSIPCFHKKIVTPENCERGE